MANEEIEKFEASLLMSKDKFGSVMVIVCGISVLYLLGMLLIMIAFELSMESVLWFIVVGCVPGVSLHVLIVLDFIVKGILHEYKKLRKGSKNGFNIPKR